MKLSIESHDLIPRFKIILNDELATALILGALAVMLAVCPTLIRTESLALSDEGICVRYSVEDVGTSVARVKIERSSQHRRRLRECRIGAAPCTMGRVPSHQPLSRIPRREIGSSTLSRDRRCRTATRGRHQLSARC
jgi:hypothetical protein